MDADRHPVVRLSRAAWSGIAILRRAGRRARETMSVYDKIVDPVVRATVDNPFRAAALGHTLRAWSVKGSHVIGSYCRMAGVPFPVATAVLGSCFARVYDDLLDARPKDDHDVADRIATMIAGGPFAPRSEIEELLRWLYQELSDRLDRDRRDPIYRALAELHGYQARSCPAAGAGLAVAELRRMSVRKGALSLVVLFALATRDMADRERALVGELGGCLQLLDDYQDREVDRRLGIATPATAGRLELWEIFRELRRIEPHLCAYYGPEARRFLDEVYLFLAVSAVGRVRLRLRSPRWSGLRRGGARSALRVLVERGGTVVD
ncbi:hypothetical protein ABGB07_05645 [Micromonosporaceae bacterium B7E4]